MRIGLVLDDTLDTSDGVQQYVLNVGSWLSGQGHEVHYLVGKTLRTDIPNVHSMSRNVSVKFNGNRMSVPMPTSRRKIRALLKQYKFDVLHVQVPYSPFMAGRLLRLVPKETAVIGTFHILPYSGMVRFANQLLAIMNARTARRFDKLLAVSRPAQEFAETVYAYKDMLVVPNPVRLQQFEDVHTTVAPQPLNVVFLGRLVERKGAQHLLAAILELKRRKFYDREIRVIIGGKGALLGKLQEFVARNNMKSYVSFVGFIDEAHKAKFLAKADLAVFPSTSGESFGIVLLEAMAAARGVVLAGDNPGYSSVMQPMPKQLFSPARTDEFSEKLAYWLNNSKFRRKAMEYQKTYVKQFDVDVVGGKLVSIYEQTLQSRRQA